MHPKQIISDFKTMGATFVLDNDELYIDNPENIYPELEELAKSYKARIVAFMKGNYSDQDHAVKQTIDKIINCFLRTDEEVNQKIENWIGDDPGSVELILTLFVELRENGWMNLKESISNFENDRTDKLSKEIFDRAMTYFRRK
ncbi:hypothetical protein [Peribacillus sp. NPDC096540]|uniref:hypothetical protein n=1 Tax=Peribacillus sp. NPDC096540 TaxID=3390612 RepID=UPI003D06F675